MDAYDFSLPVQGKEEGFTFGMDSKKAAETLRDLATKLERGQIALQSCKVSSTAKRNDFGYTTLQLLFAEQGVTQTPAPIKKSKKSMKHSRRQEIADLLKPYLGEVRTAQEDFTSNMQYAMNLQKNLFGDSKFPVEISKLD